jgi:glutathione S-transferase
LQFPASHYCEKTRWNLDAKGLSYTTRNLLPGMHVVVNRTLGARHTVPVLIDGDRVVGDSTSIALYLEDEYPERPLVPRDAAARAKVLELEAYFDDKLGPAVRRWIWGKAIAEPGLAARIFFRGYPRAFRVTGRLASPLFEKSLRAGYRIDDVGMQRSEERLNAALDRLEACILESHRGYLSGSELSLADITAAALLGPLVAPPESPWSDLEVPASVCDLREKVRARPAGRWVAARYASDRGLR